MGVDYCLPSYKYIMLILYHLPLSHRGIEYNISVVKYIVTGNHSK